MRQVARLREQRAVVYCMMFARCYVQTYDVVKVFPFISYAIFTRTQQWTWESIANWKGQNCLLLAESDKYNLIFRRKLVEATTISHKSCLFADQLAQFSISASTKFIFVSYSRQHLSHVPFISLILVWKAGLCMLYAAFWEWRDTLTYVETRGVEVWSCQFFCLTTVELNENA